ncbi:MAG: amidohydrolase [Candidatus Ozemobacteraceae bacterium]
MNTHIAHIDVVTLDDAGTILKDTNICISGRSIAAIGKVPDNFLADQSIDGRRHAALPGFFNAHCHSAMTFERGWAEDLPLDRWFNERIWVAESALTADDVEWGAALAACEMIKSGCVAFNDHYFYMDRVAGIVERSGMKAALTWCMFGIGADKEVGTDLEGALSFIDRWQGKADGRIKSVLGPHSPYVCPPAFLREMASLARNRNLPIHLHLSESAEQVATSQRTHGKTPVALLEACGIFDGQTVVAHALYLDAKDIAILARHNVSVAHCPITYMKLAMGVNDLRPLINAGINVAIGTDGPGSNSDMDMKAAVRFTSLLQKFATNDPTTLPGDQPLRMATRNGARAMGFPETGSLEVGKRADLILFDLDKPHLVPSHDLVANLVHSARASDVDHVFIDGRLILKKGELLTLDEEKIKAEAGQRAKEMVSKNLKIVREYKG